MDKAHLKSRLRAELSNWVYLIPWTIGFFVLGVYPILMSFVYSLTDFNGVFATRIGFFNYERLFSTKSDGLLLEMLDSFGVTFLFGIVSVPIGLVAGFSLALFVKKNIPGIKFIRFLFYTPCLIPGIISSMLNVDMFASNGIINTWLMKMGFEQQTFFDSAETAFITLIVTGLFGTGGSMIIWLAALNNISEELYEAASLDGARPWATLLRITIPMCSPMIFYNLFGSVTGSLQMFGTYASLGTGPDNSLYFIAIRIYVTAFTRFEMGLSCAMSWILFVVSAAISGLVFKYSKWVYYGDEM